MTGYAIRLDGTGWRAVDGPDDVAAWESYGTDHPPVDDSGADSGPPVVISSDAITVADAEYLWAAAQGGEDAAPDPVAAWLIAKLEL